MEQIEQRANVRVQDRLQITYRIIGPEDAALTERADRFFPLIWTKYPVSAVFEEVEDANFKILPHIIDLNRKIDILVDLLINENRPQVEIPRLKDVCISASGIRIDINEPSEPGQRIALCIILPFVPPSKVFVMGEVTRSVPLESELEEGLLYETGIRFTDLTEEDYEKIIRYIFKKQRDLLKDKKRLTNEESSD